MTVVYFRFKPIEHFIKSDLYDMKFLDKCTWNNLEYFDITQKGEEILGEDYINIEIAYDIIMDYPNIQQGTYKNGQLGQYITEHNNTVNFYPIIDDWVEGIFTKEEYPEYYL